MRSAACLGLIGLAALPFIACSSTNVDVPAGEPAPCKNVTEASRFESGSPDGHADPFGAGPANQARAGRIKAADAIKQAANARNKVRVGDFVMTNGKIVAYVEDKGPSDGYNTFGGELLAIEPVGADGRPLGISQYGETLIAFSRQTVLPETVTVLADGSDGKAAIVRASGKLTNIPFLDTFKAILADEYGFPAALDYILEPGAEKLKIRLSLMNTTGDDVSFARKQMLGFFHSHRSTTYTEDQGFATATGKNAWVGEDAVTSSFALRVPGGTIDANLEVSGFQYFSTSGLAVEACGKKSVDYLEVIPAAGSVDALREAIRRVDQKPAWREVKGTVSGDAGATIPGATVHALAADGKYLTRAFADERGVFRLHLPAETVQLYATAKGHEVSTPRATTGQEVDVALKLKEPAYISIVAREGSTPLPVRVQVIPSKAVAKAPATFGEKPEEGSRLYQHFAVTGDATLPVPPGDHRVIVTRGHEYDLLDQTVTAEAGKTVEIKANLARSVDSAGVMCGDFHIHSNFSADSFDTPLDKVKGAIADGLEIPVSSEHEWIIDFQPIIRDLRLTKWAYGFPSEELTTFTFGHFGVVPIQPRPDAQNNGAIGWIGRSGDQIFQAVADLPEKPVLIVNHPSGGGFTSYFSQVSFDRAKGEGSGANWSGKFEALEVFNDSSWEKNRNASVADWLSMLDAGKTTWAIGSSDSHYLRTSPVGYPRTCMRFGHDDPEKLTAELVRDVLRSGNTTISGGLYMTVEAPGGAPIGGKSTAGTYKVVVQAPTWLKPDAMKLEVVIDGATAQTIDLVDSATGVGHRWAADVNVAPTSSKKRHYVVFHAKGGGDLSPLHPGRDPFAVSNPIFF